MKLKDMKIKDNIDRTSEIAQICTKTILKFQMDSQLRTTEHIGKVVRVGWLGQQARDEYAMKISNYKERISYHNHFFEFSLTLALATLAIAISLENIFLIYLFYFLVAVNSILFMTGIYVRIIPKKQLSIELINIYKRFNQDLEKLLSESSDNLESKT